MAVENTMQADVDYLREMAEAGRRAPLLGGAHLAAFGALTACAFVSHFVVLHQVLGPISPIFVPVVWVSYGALMGLVGSLLGRRVRGKPGLSALSNQAEQVIWGIASTALFGIAVGAIGHMIMTSDETAPNAIPPAAFALYGAALMGSAHFSDAKFLRTFGWIAIAFSVALGVVADAPCAYLVAAGGVLMVLTIPGLVLLAREPRTMA